MRAVADRAALSHGTVLFHFNRRDQLIASLLESVLDATTVLRVPAEVERLTRPAERLRALLRAEMARLSSDPRHFRLFLEYWALGVRNAAIRRKVSAALERYRAAFRATAESFTHDGATTRRRAPNGSREFKTSTPDGVAAVAVSLIHGCALQAVIDPRGLACSNISTPRFACSTASAQTGFLGCLTVDDSDCTFTSFAKDQMNPFAFCVALLLIGLTTGWAVGAVLSFTGGRRRIDLVAGLSGAVLAGLPLHLLGPPGYRETLPALLVGVFAALLATWLTRILSWKPEPVLQMADEAPKPSHEQLRHDVMTTAEGSRLLLSGGKLTLPDRSDAARRPYAEPAGVGD